MSSPGSLRKFFFDKAQSFHDALLNDDAHRMSKRLSNTSLVPPAPRDGFVTRDGKPVKSCGQFWHYVTDSDTWIFAGDYFLLIERVREHLVTNRMPVPADLESAVSESICVRTPANWRGCREADRPRVNMVTWGQMKRWFRTMAAFAKDRELVSQEEAERRSSICMQCRMRVSQAECKTGGCGGSVAGFVTQLAINRSTPFDDELGACGVCGCILKAMAHFPNQTLNKASAGLEYPSDVRKEPDDGPAIPCWRRADGEV